MASAPIFVGTPKTWHAALATANTNLDGTGTVVTVVTAGTAGTRLDRLRVIAAAAVTAGAVNLFLHDGTNYRLFRTVMVEAATPSASVEPFTKDIEFPGGLFLPNGWSLRASTRNSEAINVIVQGGDV